MNMGHQVLSDKMNDGQGSTLLEITFRAIMVATQDLYWLRRRCLMGVGIPIINIRRWFPEFDFEKGLLSFCLRI